MTAKNIIVWKRKGGIKVDKKHPQKVPDFENSLGSLGVIEN